MAKQGGSLPRGRRLRHEVPDVPDRLDLTTNEGAAQDALTTLVEAAGGRFESPTAIPLGAIAELADLLDTWGRSHAIDRGEGLYFGGRPGLWHALDELYPLQDPNRWDNLRREVIRELERRGWRRASMPRGTAFYIPDSPEPTARAGEAAPPAQEVPTVPTDASQSGYPPTSGTSADGEPAQLASAHVGRVFVCHSSADATLAVSVVASLEAAGVPCWVAPRDIPLGHRCPVAIGEALESASALVFLFSASSADSRDCEGEIEIARHDDVPIVAVRLDATALPSGLRYLLSTRQWLDASGSDPDDWLGALALALAPLAGAAGPDLRSTLEVEEDPSPSGVSRPNRESGATDAGGDPSASSEVGAKSGDRVGDDKYKRRTIAELQGVADEHGLGATLAALLAASQGAGLASVPMKHGVMIAPLSHRNRYLLWFKIIGGRTPRIDFEASVSGIGEFFGLTEEQVRSCLGADRSFAPGESVEELTTGITQLFSETTDPSSV